jgi:hypothetical protein
LTSDSALTLRVGAQGSEAASMATIGVPIRLKGNVGVDRETTTSGVRVWEPGKDSVPFYGCPYGFKRELLWKVLPPHRYVVVDTDSPATFDLPYLKRKTAKQEKAAAEQVSAYFHMDRAHQETAERSVLGYDSNVAKITPEELRAMPITEVFEPVSDARLRELYVPCPEGLPTSGSLLSKVVTAGVAIGFSAEMLRRLLRHRSRANEWTN